MESGLGADSSWGWLQAKNALTVQLLNEMRFALEQVRYDG